MVPGPTDDQIGVPRRNNNNDYDIQLNNQHTENRLVTERNSENTRHCLVENRLGRRSSI